MIPPELLAKAGSATRDTLSATLEELFPAIREADPPLLDPEVDTILAEVAKATKHEGVTLTSVRSAWRTYLATKEGAEGSQRSQASALIELGQELYRFGLSEAGETFGVPHEGPKVAVLMRGGQHSMRAQLAREYYRRHGRAASQQALADALLTLDGFAQEAEPERVHQRVAEYDGAWWLDMGDNTGRAVRIADGKWTEEPEAPVLFKRSPLTGALPRPARGGNLEEFWSIASVTEEDRPLLLAALIASFRPDIGHPIVGLFGEQGAGKSTVLKALVLLLDPGPVPYRKPPRDADTWVTAAAGSWMVGIDNLSTVPDWLSDSLCRAVTGDGDVRRKLYTDGQLATFAFRRVILLTGIDLGALNGDLAERLLHIELEAITEEARIDEEELWAGWSNRHPRLLGALLDLAAQVAQAMPSVRLDRKPRMADFARVLKATDQVLGTNGLERYMSAAGRMAADSLTGDSFVSEMHDRLRSPFEGTSGELLNFVTPHDEKWRTPKDWPKNARAVTQRLRKQAPVMRKAGWQVSHDSGSNKAKVLRWTIAPPDTPPGPENARNEPPPDPPPPPDKDEARQARTQEASTSGGSTPAEPPPAGHEPPPSGSTPAEPPPIPRPNKSRMRRNSERSGGSAGFAGVKSDESQGAPTSHALRQRALERAKQLASLSRDELKAQAKASGVFEGDRHWWSHTVLSEPLQVAVAADMVRADLDADQAVREGIKYLTAAREAVKEVTP